MSLPERIIQDCLQQLTNTEYELCNKRHLGKVTTFHRKAINTVPGQTKQIDLSVGTRPRVMIHPSWAPVARSHIIANPCQKCYESSLLTSNVQSIDSLYSQKIAMM